MPFGKNTKTVELAAGKVLMLYKFENMVRSCAACCCADVTWRCTCCLSMFGVEMVLAMACVSSAQIGAHSLQEC